MASITDKGFQLTTANEWFNREIELYRSIDSRWNLDPSTPDGLKIASDAETFANLDELALYAYDSKDPNKAQGYELDVLLYLTTGTTRKQGTPSTAIIDLTGVDGTIVAAGSIIESIENGEEWSIDDDITIVGGVGSGSCSSVNVGTIQASINSLTRIKTPIGGWETVSNPDPATPGTNVETDAEVRLRRNLSVATAGSNQVDNMLAAIFNVDDVIDVVIPENFTGSTNADGLPPHSISVIVDGGDDLDIATAMYNKKNPGCALHPANVPVDVPVTSPVTGNSKTMTFSRPDYQDMIVEVTVVDDGTLPPTIESEIIDAIILYADGAIEDVNGDAFNQTGFRIGVDVAVGRLYTPVNSVVGKYNDSYCESITVNGGTATISIEFNERARFTESNISVIVI